MTNTKKRWLVVFATFVIFAFVVASAVLWGLKTVKAPNSSDSATVDFVINKGEGAGDIAKSLGDKKLIKNYFVFVMYLNWTKQGAKLQVGEYKIAKNLNMIEVTSILVNGKIVTGKITIPEGWTNEQIANYLAKNTAITAGEFIEAAKYDPAKYKYDFLYPLKPGYSLEGYLYPDTYQVSLKPTAEEVVKKMLENFDKKLTAADRTQIGKSGLNPYEVVILASIVEREVANSEDRKKVAGVFLNRLNNDMPLESCATIQYILKSDKWVFTYEETRTPSPYNTYLNPGLPVGPIGNPSIQSIKAVLFPEKTNYFYFLSSKGKTYFSTTLDEHNAKKAQYLQ